jgi:hypothetical protein
MSKTFENIFTVTINELNNEIEILKKNDEKIKFKISK